MNTTINSHHFLPFNTNLLLEEELIHRDSHHLLYELVDDPVKVAIRDCLPDESNARCLRPAQYLSGVEYPARSLHADPVHPHGRRGAAPDARGRVADLGVVRGEGDVAAESHVTAATDGDAANLAHDGLLAASKAKLISAVFPQENSIYNAQLIMTSCSR